MPPFSGIRSPPSGRSVDPDANTLRLYDVKNDPHEIKDLAGEASMKSVMKELYGQLVELQKGMNDDLDLSELAP